MKTGLQGLFPWLVALHTILFLLFWLTNQLFYASTNDYLVRMTGVKINFISAFLVFAGVVLVWSIFQLLSARFLWTYPLRSVLFWLYIFASILFIVLFYGGFWLLFRESPGQWVRIGQLLGYFRIFLDPFLWLALVALVGLALKAIRPAQAALSWAMVAGGAGVLILAWVLPLFFPPGSVYRNSLPPKPKIIAHRGAAMLAPENTLASARLASGLGVYGLETDIHLTRDGALILLHDDTLKRTTDVDRIFPGREKERVETFTLAEVRQLNAGAWYLQDDPYQAVAGGKVPPAQSAAYASEKIPLLADELEVVKQNGLVFIFDLKQPPEGHPFAQSFFEVCLRQIQQAQIDTQVWFLVDANQLAKIQAESPQMIRATGLDYKKPLPAERIKGQGYQLVNTDFGLAEDWIRAYREAGLWVNLYTVDEPWQFSRLWFTGVDSITTNNAAELTDLLQPVLAVPYDIYRWIWITIGMIGLAVFYFLMIN